MVFITGASSGIGEACARLFAKKGYDLWLCARRLDRLMKLQTDLVAAHGIRVNVSLLDVSSRAQVERYFTDNAKALQAVRVLVNNAGLAMGLDPIQGGDPKDWDLTIDTNIKGLLYVTRGFLPHFVAGGFGHVINIGSVASRWSYPRGNVYCATKRAVSALTECMRLDLLGTGVRISEVAPGLVETEFSRVRFKGDAERAAGVYRNVRCLQAIDVAEAVAWVAERPAHIDIQELVIYPTDQASTNHFHRKS